MCRDLIGPLWVVTKGVTFHTFVSSEMNTISIRREGDNEAFGV